ncbi:hypothetical protein [Pantoea sp. FN0307]|uniref:hypothetical protein n=1 Tax=Pantoea sp. FN0307 TaxID=3418560 RepID=UPI003CF378EA
MGGKDANYQIVYRGESLDRFKNGKWVFFQRRKEYDGGYCFGRTLSHCFWLEFERPTSLFKGIKYLTELNHMHQRGNDFDDDFTLV